ncbi:coenzyme F430 synthase [Methanobrevibacter sp. DSM 116169]|uniref:coenzyme F430 synthase n=1 Tax=Methanobrevibacter sp. DSM 116169 TaxID=3242727 RepID=UPI0038FC2D46
MNTNAGNKCLIIDLTHGGVKLASKISKLKAFKDVYIYDIYKTAQKKDKDLLNSLNVKLIDNLKDLEGNILVISPIHLPLTNEEIIKEINNNKNTYRFMTHHEAVKFILNDFLKKHNNLDIIEITGVKGKTSSGFILNEILKKHNTLLLSSLGAFIFKNETKYKLKENISITPANILETIDLAEKIKNPPCSIKEKSDDIDYNISIFENSLGTCGIGDVGLLTNIIENYKIANAKKDASNAKKQIFNCKLVVIEEETLNKFYQKESEEYKDKINTFSINPENSKANLVLKDVKYSLDKTILKIEYNSIITKNKDLLTGKIEIETFALGPHHLQNILGAITTSLTLNISKKEIIEGLTSFKGLKGRSSIKQLDKNHIIEEINPGLNTKSIKASIDMLQDIENYYIIIGGSYGITCEEIDEEKLAKYLDNLSNNDKYNLILTGELGRSLQNKINNKIDFVDDYKEAQKIATQNNKNILFIYRSNYKDLSKR